MKKVFIGGSRKVMRLVPEVRARIDRIVDQALPVLIGDANGADRAVQRYLAERKYAGVEVFCADPAPRNNLGGWGVRVVQPRSSRRDFEHYAAKDRAMAAEASVGLMLWDGASHGTLMNVVRLAAAGKPVIIHVQPRKSFVEIRTPEALAPACSASSARVQRRGFAPMRQPKGSRAPSARPHWGSRSIPGFASCVGVLPRLLLAASDDGITRFPCGPTSTELRARDGRRPPEGQAEVRHTGDELILSATDLTQFLCCPYGTALEMAAALGEREAAALARPAARDPVAAGEGARARGTSSSLRAQGRSVVDLRAVRRLCMRR